MVILAEDFRVSRFTRDPEILGKTVSAGPRQHTVVGVMPSDFLFHDAGAVWLPLRARPVDYPEG